MYRKLFATVESLYVVDVVLHRFVLIVVLPSSGQHGNYKTKATNNTNNEVYH